MARSVARAVLAAVLVAVLVAACSAKEEENKPTLGKPEPMTIEEVTRGREACGAYVKRLYSCAESKTELADLCHMKGAKISALEMLVTMDKTEKSTATELYKSQETARKIIAACIKENNELDVKGCDR